MFDPFLLVKGSEKEENLQINVFNHCPEIFCSHTSSLFLVIIVHFYQYLAALVRLDHKLALLEVDFACLKIRLAYAHL